jgi:site-specific DNA recombinase
LTAVALYTRVSTEDQAKEGFSLDAQKDRLLAYCKARDWDVAGDYVDDGHSGRSVKRPAYQRMMQDKDLWDAILVIKMDRIHRNARNFMEMMDNLQKWGKDFVSATESLDTSTAMGRFVMDIIQRIAQLESEQIGERVYMGMSQKAKSGSGILGSPAPYGYRFENGEYVVVEPEAEVVREIFDEYCDGSSLADLCHHLKRRGIATRNGKEWSKMSLALILHNPVYIGKPRWDGLPRTGNHPSIVQEDIFERVQEVSSSRLRNRPYTKIRRIGEEIHPTAVRRTATPQEG